MLEVLLYSLLAALLAFLVSSASIPLVRRVALAVRAVDYPGGRREQAEAIPRLGGVAVVLGLAAGGGSLVLLRWSDWGSGKDPVEMAGALVAICIIFLTGLLEDTVGLSTSIRFLLQGIAAMLVIAVGWSFESLYLPILGEIELGLLTGLVTLLWLVGVTNAINLLDGLDGLSGGIAAIIASTLLVFSLLRSDFLTALVMGAMVGACLGFLRHNWAPARIYMGDAGSLTLGFLLAIITAGSSIKSPTAVAILVPILALGLPVIDTLLVMAVRFFQRPHGSLVKRCAQMFHADRNHLHHLMVRLGPSRGRIVLIIYGVAATFCGMGLIVAMSKNARLGFFLVALEILVVLGMRHLGLHASALKISLRKREMLRELLFPSTSSADETVPESSALKNANG